MSSSGPTTTAQPFHLGEQDAAKHEQQCIEVAGANCLVQKYDTDSNGPKRNQVIDLGNERRTRALYQAEIDDRRDCGGEDPKQ